jgi:hypothetical protein
VDDLNSVLKFVEVDKVVFPCVPVSRQLFVCQTCVPLYTEESPSSPVSLSVTIKANCLLTVAVLYAY